MLQGLRVVGCSSAVGCNGGMRAFGGTGHGTGANSSLQSADQARGSPGSDQRGTGAQGSGVGGVENGSDTNGTKELDLQLRVTLPNMPAQVRICARTWRVLARAASHFTRAYTALPCSHGLTSIHLTPLSPHRRCQLSYARARPRRCGCCPAIPLRPPAPA